MIAMNNEQRIVNKGGSLPLAPASSVATLPAVSCATPSVIGTQLRKAQMIALTLAPLSVAATAPAWCREEVGV